MIPITPQAEVGVVASAPKNRGIFPFKPPVLYPYTHTKFFGDFENRRCLTSATLRAVNAPIGDGRLGVGVLDYATPIWGGGPRDRAPLFV